MFKCEICEEFNAKYVCRLCHRYVCEYDYDTNLKVCKVCRELLCHICKKRLAVSLCVICGKPICRIDSIRKNLSRICRDCIVTLSNYL